MLAGLLLATTDWAGVATTGGVGGVVVGFGIFFARGSGLQYRALKQTIVDLRLDIKTVREERNYEHKLRIAAELSLELAEADFRRFLVKKNIDPNEFKLSSNAKVREISGKVDS